VNKTSTSLLKFLLICVASLISVVGTTSLHGSDIPSCSVIAASRSQPGASPKCAPQIIENDKAFQVLKSAEQIAFKWYIFGSESEWKKLPPDKVWGLLALTVSAIQSLHDSNADVMFVVSPNGDAEKLLLLYGQYPSKKIKAHARYMASETIELKGEERKGYPPGHKQRLYTLIVY
jgi:hypothetical protein